MDKETLRRVYLEKRMMLSEKELVRRNESIKQNFFEQVNLKDTKHLHIFLPIQKKAEVDTWKIIDELRSNNPEICISIPRVMGDKMESVVFENIKQLKLNNWGLLEPRHGRVIEPSLLDIVLLPLVIFDKKGYRIGYGKGYYDRYLQLCKSDTRKIGLSLLPPVDDMLCYEKHDITMDACITGSRMINFEN